MRLDDIPLFGALKGRLEWLNRRQQVLAENVANADTPGYVPRDLKPARFDEALGRARGAEGAAAPVRLARTSSAHLSAPAASTRPPTAQARPTPDSETTQDGNAVVLEEQMLKIAESRMAYDAAIGFYQKSLNLLRAAARPPGR